MGVGDIIFLCMIVAAASGFITWLVASLVSDNECYHNYEEVSNDEFYEGNLLKSRVIVHMCKKCGKRKITKVK